MKKVVLAGAAIALIVLVIWFNRGGYDPALAIGEAALKTAGPDVSALVDVAEALEDSCAKNSHGMSEEECVQTIRAKKERCAQRTAEKYPGKLSSTEKLGAAVGDFVGCLFPKQGQ